MTAMTTIQQQVLLDVTLGLGSGVLPETAYLSLHTADPTDEGLLDYEVSMSSSGYARQEITSKMTATDTNGVSGNSLVITFGPATIDWGTITHLGIHNADVGGVMKMRGALQEVQTTPVGESVQFEPGQVIARLQ